MGRPLRDREANRRADPSPETLSATIAAEPEAVFAALLDPAALEVWQAPGEMTGHVYAMDARVGGGYEMSLFYPATDAGAGKTRADEDRFTVRFDVLDRPSHIRQRVAFVSDDAAFGGEMVMDISLQPVDGGTRVSIAYAGLPAGIRPEDNAEGTRQSLAKLARYVTGEA